MIACSAFSQGSYPQVLIREVDTVVCITLPQMRGLVALRYAADDCDSSRLVLDTELGAYQQVSHDQDSLFTASQDEMKGYDAEVVLLTDRIRDKDQEGVLEKKIARRKKIRSLVGSLAGGMAAGAAAVVVFELLIK
jgi:hypothetical protein